MIVDSLARLALYQDLHPSLSWIADYVKTHDLASIPLGRHVLTEGIALLREDYSTRDPQPGGYEYHKRFADLQIVVRGEEILAVAHKDHASFAHTIPYDDAKDVAKGDCEGATNVILREGMFCFVYPHEYHQPKLRVNDRSAVIKAVFKIAL
jgi:biofilm protein TabA